MAYPDDPVPVVVEIAPGADPAGDPGDWTWLDITTSARLQDGIEMTTGRPNEASRVDPSRCTLRLDNSTGDFTPRNPAGQWYGQLSRNTPIRVRIRSVEDAFDRTLTSSWGSADSGQVWDGFGVGGIVAAADFTVSGGQARHFVPVANGYRASWLSAVSLLDVEVVLTVDTFIGSVSGAAIEPAGILLRMQDINTYYMARVEIDAAEAVTIKLYHSTGGPLASAAVPSITWAGQPMRVRAAIVANRLSAKVWDPAAGSEPAGWQVDVSDSTLTAPGGIGIRSGVAAGNTNTMPVEFRYDDLEVLVDRFSGFVSSWPPRWDLSGNDATVPIQADGVLRRLGQGSPPSRSALRRTIPSTSPLAYWPVEDGANAGQVASAFAGHPPLTIGGSVTFDTIESWSKQEQYTVTYGTAALADLSSGATLQASAPASVTAATTSGWTVAVATDIPLGTEMSADSVLAEIHTPGGTYVKWRLLITKATFDAQLIAYDSAGAGTVILTSTLPFFTLVPHNVAVWQSGGTIQAGYNWDSVIGYEASGSIAGTLAGVTRIVVNPTSTTATVPWAVGHIALWAGHDLAAVDFRDGDMWSALYGWAWSGLNTAAADDSGEPATVRLARLAAEDGVTIHIPTVDATAEVMMGPQRPSTPLALYQECENADQGVLYESGFSLAYLPRDSRYNRTTALTLDFDAGQVAAPPEPVDDDQQLRNRVTVRRTDGSSAVAEDTASITAVGAYEDSVDVNLAADETLTDHASWRVHLGTVDEMRWPRIDVNLARSPELIDAVLSCRVQSRVQADNPPAEVAGDAIDVIVEGYSETIGYKDWLVSLNTSPAAPWDVATADGEQGVAADGATLAASLTVSGTSMSLATTTTNRPWTTAAADFPLDLLVGGERVTVSAISGTSSPQTATISARAVNGVSQAWPAGTTVDVWLPAVMAL